MLFDEKEVVVFVEWFGKKKLELYQEEWKLKYQKRFEQKNLFQKLLSTNSGQQSFPSSASWTSSSQALLILISSSSFPF